MRWTTHDLFFFVANEYRFIIVMSLFKFMFAPKDSHTVVHYIPEMIP